MRHLRHWLRHRHPAQDMVQFGLMTAAVAIVALAGLEFLSGSLRWYFGDVAPNLAPKTVPMPGFPLHDITSTFKCGPSNTILLGDKVSCQITIIDKDNLNPQPPLGDIAIMASPPGSQVAGCPLQNPPPWPISPPPGPGLSGCTFDYQPSQAGSFDLTLKYTPKSNHIGLDPSSAPAVSLLVLAKANLTVSCLSSTDVVESPLACTATLQTADAGANPIPNKTLSWSLGPGSAGPGAFTCLGTNCPTTPSFSCTTDGSGKCGTIFSAVTNPGGYTLVVAFPQDPPSASPPYAATSGQFGVTAVLPNPLHATTVSFDSCPAVVGSIPKRLHCTVTVTDNTPQPTPQNAGKDSPSPPVGSVTLAAQRGSLIQNSTCGSLTPWLGWGESTCQFDVEKVSNGDDTITGQYVVGPGDVVHAPDPSDPTQPLPQTHVNFS